MNLKTTIATTLAGIAMLLSTTHGRCDEAKTFRPPAVPLVACDPYFSVWSQTDNLWSTETTHWTGTQHRMAAIVRVDGTAYRLMGAGPQPIAAMEQQSVHVLPTQTVYRFSEAKVAVKLTFTTPSLPDDIAILSRPTTYVDCEVTATDGKLHDVEFYFDAGGELATNELDQQVAGNMASIAGVTALEIGTQTQKILGRSGDDLRIDWGYLYVAADNQFAPVATFGDAKSLRQRFAKKGVASLSATGPEHAEQSFPVDAGKVVASIAMSMGKVGAKVSNAYVLIAYDDLFSIEFMKKRLRPYWRKDGWQADDLISAAIQEHDELIARCETFDAELMADAVNSGGQEYADICSLAYRQCLAAGKFVADENGQPLQFCKENHSNGCIATSDVFYPMIPQFLLFGPTMTKSVLVPFMEYAASDRWRFPYAPHDLGTYPKANGQRYGGGENSEDGQMPVEESGNLLILFGALAKMEGNADFAELYWPQVSQWASYLKEKGFDPENQLCTDDFAGHMAHNVNLSAKAIMGLGSYAMLCEMRGMNDEAQQYQAVAKKYAAQWIEAARDGDHFVLAFDRKDTWSQKYNLVWDRILGLDLFPDEVLETEMAFYRKSQNEYGLPLDSRSDYTKLDWVLWTATLTQNRKDFDALTLPVHRFLNATPQRTPMTDWYFTSTADKVGFDARPVVGGVFLKMLYDSTLWAKHAGRDQTKAKEWAPMPIPPKTITLIPTGEKHDAVYHYVTTKPTDDWFTSDFAIDGWKKGMGGLGTETPSKTRWASSEIWTRRTVNINSPIPNQVGLRIWHDEDATVYINGKQIISLGGYTTGYEVFEIPATSLKQGDNIVAIHVRQTTGGQFIDFGIDKLVLQQ
ncbi:glutaminase family protein [Rubripirellula reticaptiva]|uniref:Glutaminase A n=1 Tax=Rubripirellula reticaptiva TaxID=2528013 RepID=A0A5C6FC27_9BACT|nr:glutaminase family protein [Rubripirellula reticaptiva]TWU57854.1 hypothetical protein Poly59_07630 [Rubripirellula reticaptiva]